MRGTRLSNLQALACFVIAVAGLVPVFHKNRPFWGLNYVTLDYGLPTVFEVEPESPADRAGLQVNDEFLTANGSGVDDRSLIRALNALKPGDTVRLGMLRQGRPVEMTATAEEPPIAWIYYSTVWHPGVGVVAGMLGLILLAARPPRPAPRWLPAFIFVGGVGLATIFYLAITSHDPFPYLPVRQYHMLNAGARWHFEQSWVGLAASLVLVTLTIWQLGGQLRSSVGDREASGAPVSSVA